MDQDARVVTVEILGHVYPIRSALDGKYVGDLASYVDEKMQTAADRMTGSDSVKVAVLAALNIADEYFRCRDAGELASADVRRRAAKIETLVDQALSAAEQA